MQKILLNLHLLLGDVQWILIRSEEVPGSFISS